MFINTNTILGKQLCKTNTREIYKSYVVTLGGGVGWGCQDDSLNLTAPWQGRPHGEPGPKIEEPHLIPGVLVVRRARCRPALNPESLPLRTKRSGHRALGDHLRL